MSNFVQSKQVLVTHKSDGKQLTFDSIREASEALGISRAVISRALNNALHYTHHYGCRTNKDGTVSIHTRYCDYDFEWLNGEPVAELWCETDPNLPCFKAYSHHQAIKMLGCSKPTYYKRKKDCVYGEPCKDPIMDSEGRFWMVVFNDDSRECKSNLRKLQG